MDRKLYNLIPFWLRDKLFTFIFKAKGEKNIYVCIF